MVSFVLMTGLDIQEYDLKQGIVKGTFEFTGMSAGGKQVSITKGEFLLYPMVLVEVG